MRSVLQSLVHQGATLIAEERLSDASCIHRVTLQLLQEMSVKLASEPCSQSPSKTRQRVALVPIARGGAVASPELDDELFAFPFSVWLHCTAEESMDQETVATCSVASVFNTALSLHLESTKGRCGLRSACNIYENAWQGVGELSRVVLRQRCDEHSRQEEEGGAFALLPDGTTFLLMAICTNVARCYQSLGDLQMANVWLCRLQELVKRCGPREDLLSSHLHNFFIMTSLVHTPFIAAGAA